MIKKNFEGTMVLFDSSSDLHNKTLQFIEKRERGNYLSFIPFHSEIGQILIRKLNLTNVQLTSIILLENGQCYTKSTAILRLAGYLKGGWSLTEFFLIIPKVVRDNVFLQFIKRL